MMAPLHCRHPVLCRIVGCCDPRSGFIHRTKLLLQLLCSHVAASSQRHAHCVRPFAYLCVRSICLVRAVPGVVAFPTIPAAHWLPVWGPLPCWPLGWRRSRVPSTGPELRRLPVLQGRRLAPPPRLLLLLLPLRPAPATLAPPVTTTSALEPGLLDVWLQLLRHCL